MPAKEIRVYGPEDDEAEDGIEVIRESFLMPIIRLENPLVFLVLYVDGEPAGALAVVRRPEDDYSSFDFYVGVLPEHRGNRYAESLVDAALGWAPDSDEKTAYRAFEWRVNVQNPRIRDILLERGFDEDYGGWAEHRPHMTRNIET